jgi:hypothetical protein
MDNVLVKVNSPSFANVIEENGNQEYPSDTVTLVIRKRFFYRKAEYSLDYLYDSDPTTELLVDLKKRQVDLFTFVERSFIQHEHKYLISNENESIAVLRISSFDDWWNFQINKKARNLVRKAEKIGVRLELVEVNEDFIRGTQRIYNETPIRGGRRYGAYGMNLAYLRKSFMNLQRSDIIGAYYKDELIGFTWVVYGDRVARIKVFMSLIKHRNKAPNNLLMAEAIRRCCKRGFHFLVYEKMGYLQGLDSFKVQNGFKTCITIRYFVPLSNRGMLAMKFRIHKDIAYSLSPSVVRALLPTYSVITRVIPLVVWNRQKYLRLL